MRDGAGAVDWGARARRALAIAAAALLASLLVQLGGDVERAGAHKWRTGLYGFCADSYPTRYCTYYFYKYHHHRKHQRRMSKKHRRRHSGHHFIHRKDFSCRLRYDPIRHKWERLYCTRPTTTSHYHE